MTHPRAIAHVASSAGGNTKSFADLDRLQPPSEHPIARRITDPHFQPGRIWPWRPANAESRTAATLGSPSNHPGFPWRPQAANRCIFEGLDVSLLSRPSSTPQEGISPSSSSPIRPRSAFSNALLPSHTPFISPHAIVARGRKCPPRPTPPRFFYHGSEIGPPRHTQSPYAWAVSRKFLPHGSPDRSAEQRICRLR